MKRKNRRSKRKKLTGHGKKKGRKKHLSYKENEMTGVFSRTKDGFGFVMDLKGNRPDVFVPVGATEGALSGDIVSVSIGRKTAKGPRGRIVRIEEKRPGGFLATVREYGGTLYAVPDDPGAGDEVYIRNQSGTEADHRVLIEFDRESLDSGMSKGKVIEDFGHIDDPGVDLAAVVGVNGYSWEYPSEAAAEGEEHSRKPIDLNVRKDLRDIYTCTVDPASARDFDDAISVEDTGKGWEVWVHIADVAFYVAGGGVLDKEALRRSTSVYLLDRVIPMLPECLSNETCSLNQGVDRAAKSVRMSIDRKGNITGYDIHRTVIRSDRRFSYEEVQLIIEGGSEDRDRAQILIMHEAASALRKKRFKEGGIQLDIPEMNPVVDSDGGVLELKQSVQKESNQLIEDMMLAANRCVADYMIGKNLNGPFRIHEEPDPLKKKELSRYLSNFGIGLKADFTRRELMDVLKQAAGKKDAYIVNLAVLRSFKQAEYSVSNEGHFALAFDRYLHFTSPIRRYPDLAVHRTLDRILFGLETGNGPETGSMDKRGEMVRTCNENERKAMQAENTLNTTKIIRYISSLPEETVLEGVISRVEESYLAVELVEYLVYGRLYLADFESDVRFEKNSVTLREQGKSVRLRTGSEVRVRVSEADPFRRTIELKLDTQKSEDEK